MHRMQIRFQNDPMYMLKRGTPTEGEDIYEGYAKDLVWVWYQYLFSSISEAHYYGTIWNMAV